MIDIAAWGWPQFVYVALIILGLGVNLAKCGNPDTKPTATTFWAGVISSLFIWMLLIVGGFFA